MNDGRENGIAKRVSGHVGGRAIASLAALVLPVSVGCSTGPSAEPPVAKQTQPLMPYVCNTSFGKDPSKGECSTDDVCATGTCQHYLWDCERFGHRGRLYAVSVDGNCACATECDTTTRVPDACSDDWDCGAAESCVDGECRGWGS